MFVANYKLTINVNSPPQVMDLYHYVPIGCCRLVKYNYSTGTLKSLDLKEVSRSSMKIGL